MEDYYQILGVTSNATQEEITRRYRFLVIAYHPDRFSERTKEEASREMARINIAYEVLSDPLKRSAYDRQRANNNASQGKSPGSQPGSSTGSGTPYSSQQAQSYQGESNRIEEAFEYIDRIVTHWKPYIQTGGQSLKRDQVIHQYQIIIRKIADKLSVHMGEQGKNLFREEMDTYLAAIIVINIALGIELEASTPPAGFSREDITEYSIVPIRQQINFVLNYGRARGAYTLEQSTTLDAQVVSQLRSVCQICQQDGKSIAVNLRSRSQSRRDHKPFSTSKSRPLIQYCQSCGAIGPTKKLTFIRMIGLLVFAHFRTVKGELCAECAVKYFWEFSGMTLLLGWIGVSIFAIPLIFLVNWINYLNSGAMRKNSGDLTDISRGWRVFTILGIIVVTVALVVYLSTSVNNYASTPNSDSYVYKPTTAPKKTPTMRPKPSSTVSIASSNFSTQDDCYSWNEVTALKKGKEVCVYGIVKKAFWGDENRFFITFSDNASSFRLIVLWGYYYDDIIGECIEATGVIKVYDNMPYMELGDTIDVYETTARCYK